MSAQEETSTRVRLLLAAGDSVTTVEGVTFTARQPMECMLEAAGQVVIVTMDAPELGTEAPQ